MFFLKDLPEQALTFEQAWLRGIDFWNPSAKADLAGGLI